ncbi:MAG: hypothetical protein WD737_00310 [Gemmatimonadota bacterium]
MRESTDHEDGGRSGDRRSGDRRRSDRRREDRRTPAPLWRRPAAFVAYGATGALVAVLLLRLGVDSADETVAAAATSTRVAAGEPYTVPEVPDGSVRDARTLAEFEALIAGGDRAVGQVVRAEIFCGSIGALAVREIEGMNPALGALADADGRVAAAECRWSREARASNFVLVVPPALAEDFASAPLVEINFVRRRRIPAHLVWLGRSEALALRYAGVLQEVLL